MTRLALAAVCLALAVAGSHGRKLAQTPGTTQGNATGLYTLNENTCYRAAIPLGTSLTCGDPFCCYQACNDIWETQRCEYWCWCEAAEGCTLEGVEGSSVAPGTCLLSTNFNASAATARRRRLAGDGGPGDPSVELGDVQSVQVLYGPAVPFQSGYALALAGLEPSLAVNGPLSPLKGFWRKGPEEEGVGSPAPAPSGGSRRRLQAVETFASRYYRGLDVLSRTNESSAEECAALCADSDECTYFAFCPTDQLGGCELVEVINGTTKQVPPGTCTLSYDDTIGSSSYLVMFGPGVTFYGGKWVPNGAQQVVAAAALGDPGGSVACLRYERGAGDGWQPTTKKTFGAKQPVQEPSFDLAFAQEACAADTSDAALSIYSEILAGSGEKAFAALRAAARGDDALPCCKDALYAAAGDALQLVRSLGNSTAEADAFAQAFVAAASAVGIPACVTVTVQDWQGELEESHRFHT